VEKIPGFLYAADIARDISWLCRAALRRSALCARAKMAVQLRHHGLVQVSKSLRDRVGISRFHDLGTHQSHLKAAYISVSCKLSSIGGTLQNTQAEHSKISANPPEIGRMS
jgi:hypothetical protein